MYIACTRHIHHIYKTHYEVSRYLTLNVMTMLCTVHEHFMYIPCMLDQFWWILTHCIRLYIRVMYILYTFHTRLLDVINTMLRYAFSMYVLWALYMHSMHVFPDVSMCAFVCTCHVHTIYMLYTNSRRDQHCVKVCVFYVRAMSTLYTCHARLAWCVRFMRLYVRVMYILYTCYTQSLDVINTVLRYAFPMYVLWALYMHSMHVFPDVYTAVSVSFNVCVCIYTCHEHTIYMLAHCECHA